jgi:hypothetical protein
MDKTIPFDEHAVCDTCGQIGAFDFMGDYICQECLEKLTQDTHPATVSPEGDEAP